MSDKASIEAEGAASAAPSRSVAEEAARLVSYLLLIALCGWLYVVAGDLPASRWEPLGAGAFPRLVVATLAVFCAIAALHSVRKLMTSSQWAEAGPGLRAWLAQHRLVLALFAGFGAYLAVIAQIGFVLSSFVFLLFAQLVLAPRTWRAWAVALVIAVAFSWGINFLFAEVFNIFLPRGRLFR
jgi:putative tricarboxylic transport membrane protein